MADLDRDRKTPPRAVIASGTGRYADPWHPFERTSPAIAGVLADAGFDVTVVADVDAAMAALDDVDLLVVNAGDPWRGDGTHVTAPTASVGGFADALERGIGILALHCAVASLRDYPEWAPTIGAMWVPGASYHPPLDLAAITVDAAPLDDVELPSFEVLDERYCRLQWLARVDPVAWHAAADGREPTAWIRESGASRIAVDVLGHDERSYESPGHRRMLTALARWAARA